MAVGPDPQVAFKLYWAKEKMPFVGLADSHHTVAASYGQEVKLTKFGRMPALLMVDKKGRVRFAHYADNMRDYPELQEMLEVLDTLRRERAKTGARAA